MTPPLSNVPLVQPGQPDADFHLSLDDGSAQWSFRLKDGPASLKETPLLAERLPDRGGGRFGDWEPGMSYLEQRTWEGGRGLEDFSGEATQFHDSLALWSASPGMALPAPQWRYAQGVREAVARMPGRLRWQTLVNDAHALSVPLTIGADGLALSALQLWLRQRGTAPDALTAELWTDEPATLAEIVDEVNGTGCSIHADAALSGAAGLKIEIPDTNPSFVRWNWFNDDTTLRLGFLLDASDLAMTEGDWFNFVQIGGGGSGASLQIRLYFQDGVYKLMPNCRLNDNSIAHADLLVVDSFPVRVEVDWAAAQSPSIQDGYVHMRVWDADGFHGETGLDDLNNSNRYIHDMGIGAYNGVDAGTSGALYLDEISAIGEITRQHASFEGGGAFTQVDGATFSIPASAAAAGYGELVRATLASPVSLDADTVYHLRVIAPAGSAADNAWQVGVDPALSDGWDSPNALWWYPGVNPPHARLLAAYPARSWHFFELSRALYAAEQRADGGAPRILMNGDRGLATGGSASTLVDSDAGQYGAWAADQWVGAQVEILYGAGRGQVRTISANDADTLSVARDWDIAPDATSFYVIFASDHWVAIEPGSNPLTTGVTAVAVHEDHAHFAQGSDELLYRMRFNGGLTPPGHQFESNGGTLNGLVFTFYDPEGGAQIWRTRDGAISTAAPTDWGTPMTFSTLTQLGSLFSPVTGIARYADGALIFKPEEVWEYHEGDFRQVELGYAHSADPHNGIAAHVQGGDLYFTWGEGLGRWDGTHLREAGPGMGSGLPAGRQGRVAALALANVDWMLAAADAGEDGTSAVLMHNGLGWHEVLRAPHGERITALHWQPCPGAAPRLWACMGGELVSLRFPLGTRSPLGDPGYTPQHEAVLESGVLDLGAAALPKYLESVQLALSGLAGASSVEVFIQLDEGVGGAAWLPLGTLTSAGLGALPIAVGDTAQARLRVHLHSSGDLPVLDALVVEGALRVPLRYQLRATIDFDEVAGADAAGTPLAGRDAALAFLQDAAREARPLTLGALWPHLHGATVLLDPPALAHNGLDPQSGEWTGELTLSMREVEG